MQSRRVSVDASRIIEAPIERVWAEVANFNNVAVWHPDVTKSRMQDAGATGATPGEVRVITLRNGTAVRERLVTLDSLAHRYEYSVLDGQFPLKNHISAVNMREVDADHTEVTWTASFETTEAPAEGLAEGIRQDVLELGLQGLDERSRTSA